MKKTSLLRTILAWAILILVIVVIASITIGSSAGTGNYEGSLLGGFSVLGVFLIVDIVFWIIVIKIIIRKIKDKKVRGNGIVCDATYVSNIQVASVNNVCLFKVIYNCKINGEIKEFTSGAEYSFSEVMALEERKTFKVKVYGNDSVIVEDLKNIKHKNEIEYFLEGLTKNKQEKVKCQYCGSSYDSFLSKCPNCGASKNK